MAAAVRGAFVVALLALTAAAATAAPRIVARPDSSAATRCLLVPAELTRVLRAGLGFPSGAKIRVARAVASKERKQLYFVSLAFRAAELKQRTVIGTWAVDRLTASATVVSIDANARAYSDWARPDAGAGNVSMRTDGAQASRRCVLNKLR